MSEYREITLSNQIMRMLRDEDPDTQILALTMSLMRLKLFHVIDGACPEGKAVVDRLLAAMRDPNRNDNDRRAPLP
jgi:hypothetical protein